MEKYYHPSATPPNTFSLSLLVSFKLELIKYGIQLVACPNDLFWLADKPLFDIVFHNGV
jgi:hypothetical protein